MASEHLKSNIFTPKFKIMTYWVISNTVHCLLSSQTYTVFNTVFENCFGSIMDL